jgi:tetratricopeptide repeat protein
VLRRSLALKRQALGPDHPDLAATASNLAAVRRADGDVGQAAELYAEAVRVLRDVVSPDHPTLRTCRASLAALSALAPTSAPTSAPDVGAGAGAGPENQLATRVDSVRP